MFPRFGGMVFVSRHLYNKYLIMAKYIIAIAMIVLCVSRSDAQSTFAWAIEREIISDADFIGTYTMYEIDVFSGNHTALFSIHSDRFAHDDMTGLQFQIVSFVFTEDRDQIYFLARDGDLYVYTIDTDNLIYLQDLTPKDGNFLVHNIQQLFNLYWLNSNTLYFSGQTYLTYNIDDFSVSVIRETVDFPTSFTEFENNLLPRAYFRHKGEYIYLSNNRKLQLQIDQYDPENVQTLADFSNAQVPIIPMPIISA